MSNDAIKFGQVVRYIGRGGRRYVVSHVHVNASSSDVRLNIIALSGSDKGSAPSSVRPEELELDADQTVAFVGKLAARFENRFRFWADRRTALAAE